MSRLAGSCVLMWVRTLSQAGQPQSTKSHALLRLCPAAARGDSGSWLPVLAICPRHQGTLWTLDRVCQQLQSGHQQDSHACPRPNSGVTNPRPLGFMLPSMKSTLAFLSLRRTLLTCGQIGTAQRGQGAERELCPSSCLSRGLGLAIHVGAGCVGPHCLQWLCGITRWNPPFSIWVSCVRVCRGACRHRHGPSFLLETRPLSTQVYTPDTVSSGAPASASIFPEGRHTTVWLSEGSKS